MRVHFLGVGEACDERYANTSILVEPSKSGRTGSILLDCGFTVPGAFFALPQPENLAAVYISHYHGDHFFGIPLLLLRMWEDGRKNELTIIGQDPVDEIVEKTMRLAYPNFRKKITYPIRYITAEPGKEIQANNTKWKFALTDHSQANLAVRLEYGGRTLFYSGDGAFTPQSLDLARDCDLAVHEAYGIEETTPGHGSINACLDFAAKARVKTLALVHVQRKIRRLRSPDIRSLLERAYGFMGLLPEPGEILDI